MTPEKAYCTISEAAQTLGLEKYVLRFWEGKFPQISPMKRAGGRRYYRPEDLQSIMLIKHLLYDKGMTIRGAQQLMKRKSTASLQKELESGNINSTLLAEETSVEANSANSANSYGPAEAKSILQELKDLKKLLENQPAEPLELSNETNKPLTDNS